MIEVQEAFNGSAVQEAAINVASASIEIWDYDLLSSHRVELREEDSYRLDLSLCRRLPSVEVCYADSWAAHRFEKSGNLFLLPPGETLRVRSGMGRQHVMVCRLPAARVRQWLDAEPDWTRRRREAGLDIRCQPVGDLLRQLAEETRRPGFASAIMIEALAMQLAVAIERHYQQAVETPGCNGLATWRLRAIDARLHDGDATPSLSELAAICRLSVRQLARGFKAARGLSIGSYVAQHRIEAAKELLDRGESVKVVADRMGFGTPSSFGYAFRQATGVSPSEYRSRPQRTRLL